MDEKILFDLVNPSFVIKFAGKEFTVRKANLEKAILYQERLRELVDKKDSAIDIKIAAYCLYLVLKDSDPSITEEYVIKNSPASINSLEWIETLGFMTPQKKVESLKNQGV